MTTYAVNIADLLELNEHDPILSMCLTPHVNFTQVVEPEKRKVAGIGHAVVLSCPEEQAVALIEVARKKYRKYQLRFYASMTGKGRWKRI